jgi:hypothetical protein
MTRGSQLPSFLKPVMTTASPSSPIPRVRDVANLRYSQLMADELSKLLRICHVFFLLSLLWLARFFTFRCLILLEGL